MTEDLPILSWLDKATIEHMQGELERMKTANDIEKLGVEPDDGVDEVKSAFEKIMNLYRPEALSKRIPTIQHLGEQLMNIVTPATQRLVAELETCETVGNTAAGREMQPTTNDLPTPSMPVSFPPTAPPPAGYPYPPQGWLVYVRLN